MVPRHRLGIAAVILALLAPACFLRSLSGFVTSDVPDFVDAVFADVDANAPIALCSEITDEEGDTTTVECQYRIEGGESTSTATLLGSLGLFGLLIDPVVLQVPSDVLTVEATSNHRGADEPMTVTRARSFQADASTTVTAEEGHDFLILELSDDAAQAVGDAPGEQPVEFDFDLRIGLPEEAPLPVKVMSTIRVDVDGRSYYPPMLPCTTDFSTFQAVEIPVADSPQFLLDDLAEVMGAAPVCQGTTYDFDADTSQVGRFVRIAGPDRIATAVEVSRATYPSGGQAAGVVIARADVFADALAGTPLAWAIGGPILLTGTDALDDRVAAELQRVIPTDFPVYVLGGTAAVSEQVAAQIRALGHTDVIRYGGANRFETAVVIAERTTRPIGPTYLADGETFQAALLSGAAATNDLGRVLLTAGTTMPGATQAWLDAHPDVDVVAVGDPAVAAAPQAVAVPGADPAALSVAIARRHFGTAPEEVFLASATVFADGLSGGPMTGPRNPFATYTGGALLLTDPDALSPALDDYLRAIGATLQRAAVFGGPAAVSDDVLAAADMALG